MPSPYEICTAIKRTLVVSVDFSVTRDSLTKHQWNSSVDRELDSIYINGNKVWWP